jgi:plastocyanin
MKLVSPVALAVFLGLVAQSASAGVIRGTLSVASRPVVTAAMNPYPGQASSIAGAQASTQGLPSDAVIYVEEVPAEVKAKLAAAAPESPDLAQKDQAFVPRVLAVAAGTTVDFPNLDPIYHNVFSLSPVQRFDLGKYPHGASRQVTFDKPGLVKVYCDIHSNMEAFVFVLPHHAFARPSTSGEFALPDLPQGHYVLHVWHPDLGEQKLSVNVPEYGSVIANLSY